MYFTVSLKNRKALLAIILLVLFIGIIAAGYLYSERSYYARSQALKDQEALQKQLENVPDDVNTHVNLGWSYYQQSKREEATKEFKTALKFDKKNISAMHGMGLIEKDMKQYAGAETWMNRILEIKPGHQQAGITLAQIYKEEKRYDKAASQYLTALKAAPGSADVIVELGQVYEAQGKKAEAIKQYSDALRYVPGMEEAVKGLKRLK